MLEQQLNRARKWTKSECDWIKCNYDKSYIPKKFNFREPDGFWHVANRELFKGGVAKL